MVEFFQLHGRGSGSGASASLLVLRKEPLTAGYPIRSMCVYMCVRVYIIYTYTYASLSVCPSCVCIEYINTYVYTCVYLCMCVHMHVYVYVCVWVCIHI